MRMTAAPVLARVGVLAAALSLAACGGGDKADGTDAAAPVTSTPTAPETPTVPETPGAPADPETPETPGTPAEEEPETPPPSETQTALELRGLELAQSHVIAPDGRTMRSANDAAANRSKRLELIAGRAALLMVRPKTTVASLQARMHLADDRVLGPLTLVTPDRLPATDGDRARYASDAWSVLLPKEWLQIGATLELSHSGFASEPYTVPLTVTPAVALKAYTMPFYLFGARASQSLVSDFRLSSHRTGDYTLDREYAQKMPVATLSQPVSAAIELDRLPVPPRNDSAVCHPAMSFSSWSAFQAAHGDLNARVLDLLASMHGDAANRDGPMAAGYYGYMQVFDGTRQLAPQVGGLGGGGSGISGTDWAPTSVYSAVYNHEMGHAYGLPHTDAAAASGDFPYPMGTKSGSVWGYDAVRNQLLSPRQFAGRSCDGRTVEGVCYQRTPMSGGDDDRDGARYRWTYYSDYEAAIMQSTFLDKLVRDAAVDGGYRRWNRGARAFEAVPDWQRARYGTDVVRLEQQVVTVIGTLSHHNLAPSANALFVTDAWTGNLPRQFDPASQADLDLMRTKNPGGWDDYFCVYNGCDYTLVARFGDGSSARVLLPVGYHDTNSTATRASTQNVMDGANFARYAVNLPAGRGGLRSLHVYRTPLGSRFHVPRTAIDAGLLGTSTYPLVTQWTSSDGNASGGPGGSGRTQWNSGVCQAGARVVQPAY